MPIARTPAQRFVICLQNEGYEASLERRKIYVRVDDRAAARDGMVRVIDESGESYLYPATWFATVVLPPRVGKAVARQR